MNNSLTPRGIYNLKPVYYEVNKWNQDKAFVDIKVKHTQRILLREKKLEGSLFPRGKLTHFLVILRSIVDSFTDTYFIKYYLYLKVRVSDHCFSEGQKVKKNALKIY